MPWMAWSPKGDRLAYFVRTEKERTLIIQNVLTREDRRADPDEVGRRAGVAGVLARRQDDRLRRAARRRSATSTRSISTPRRSSTSPTTRSPTRRRPTRPTASSSSTPRASAATRSCSGSTSTPRRRRRSPSARRTKRRRSSSTTTRIVFASTATDPAVPLEPEVAQERQHLQHLDARPDDRRAAAVHRRARRQLVADRAERRQDEPHRVRQLLQERVQHPHARAQGAAAHRAPSSDFGAPGPIIDFQAPLQHTLVKENVRKKGAFEKMFLEGRPPVNVGVTSNGDIFGGTQVSFGDVLGDKQINFFAASISQYRTLSLSYVEPVAALPVRAAGLLADAVLLRAARRASSTIRRSRRSSAATWRSRRARCAAAARSASIRSTATAASSCRAASSS